MSKGWIFVVGIILGTATSSTLILTLVLSASVMAISEGSQTKFSELEKQNASLEERIAKLEEREIPETGSFREELLSLKEAMRTVDDQRRNGDNSLSQELQRQTVHVSKRLATLEKWAVGKIGGFDEEFPAPRTFEE